jgi:UDP-N-acetylmuramoylalanine--D-glutamate ligase
MQKILILGAGESGTGAALLAQQKGYEVLVSDKSAIAEKYKIDLLQNNILVEEGSHEQAMLWTPQLVVKSPGIPEKADIVQYFLQQNIAVIDELEFALRYTDAKIIGITGSNGKTTTTLLTYHLLQTAGYNVGLAGNVGFSLAKQVIENKYDWYVLEISSFQLDGMFESRLDIAMLLNITPDHLDRYNYDLEQYAASKFRITQNQSVENLLITWKEDEIVQRRLQQRHVTATQALVSIQGDKNCSAYFDGEYLVFSDFKIHKKEISLTGKHNYLNAMFAVIAALRAGVGQEAIRKGLLTFVNAPHRLEPVAHANGIRFINDSKATNVDSVRYALDAIDAPIVWIAGGIDKGNDYALIGDLVKEKVKLLIAIGKDVTPLQKAFEGIIPIVVAHNITETVQLAIKNAVQGDTVLLSPACASFDWFKNYEDRGEQFKQLVKKFISSE